jgi:hypothetical protein
MGDLGYLEEQISSTSTINHALELHGKISLLKEEKDELEKENQRLSANEKDLIAQNQSQLECIEMFMKQLEDVKRMTEEGEKRQKASSEKKVREMEQDNAKLKSTLVRVQAQYKEEVYTNKKTIEGLLKECQLKNGASDVTDVKHSCLERTISEDDDRPSLPSSSNVRPLISGGGRPSLPSRPSLPTKSASLRSIQDYSRPSLPPRSASLRRIQDYKNRKQEKHASLLDDASHNTSPTSASSVSSISSGEPSRPSLPTKSASLRRIQDYSRPSLPPRSASLRRIQDYKNRKQEKHASLLDDASRNTSPTSASRVSSISSGEPILSPLRRSTSLRVSSRRLQGLHQETLSPTNTSQSLRPLLSPAGELRKKEIETIFLQHAADKDGSNEEVGAPHDFMNMEAMSSSLRLWIDEL